MTEKQTFVLGNAPTRWAAQDAIKRSPDGYVCEVRPPKRSNPQNSRLHAIFEDLERSGYEHYGEKYDAEDWKWFMCSGFDVAKGKPVRFRLGAEGERVALRRSTSKMSVPEMAEMIEYCQAWCAQHGVKLRDE